jgi:hypothetical protein
MTPGEVIGKYHDLWHVEQSFRMSKTDLRARPMFHHTRDAIEAHLTVVFTALAVARYLQAETGISIGRIVKTLRHLQEISLTIAGQPHTAADHSPPTQPASSPHWTSRTRSQCWHTKSMKVRSYSRVHSPATFTPRNFGDAGRTDLCDLTSVGVVQDVQLGAAAELASGGAPLRRPRAQHHIVEDFERVVAGVGLNPMGDAPEPCDPCGQLLDDRVHRLRKLAGSWKGGRESVDKLNHRLVGSIVVAAA